MTEWICTKCRKVATAKTYNCCGPVEVFDPVLHGRLLISPSNSWISVWEAWRDHPALMEVSRRLDEDGCYSAARTINKFIENLLEE